MGKGSDGCHVRTGQIVCLDREETDHLVLDNQWSDDRPGVTHELDDRPGQFLRGPGQYLPDHCFCVLDEYGFPAVDHLPILVAAALLRTSSESPSWREAVRLGGDRFASATASIAGGAEAHSELLRSNSESVLRWLDLFQAELAQLRRILADQDGEALSDALQAALDARESWERQDVDQAQEAPKYERGFRSLFLGQLGDKL